MKIAPFTRFFVTPFRNAVTSSMAFLNVIARMHSRPSHFFLQRAQTVVAELGLTLPQWSDELHAVPG